MIFFLTESNRLDLNMILVHYACHHIGPVTEIVHRLLKRTKGEGAITLSLCSEEVDAIQWAITYLIKSPPLTDNGCRLNVNPYRNFMSRMEHPPWLT